MVDSFSKSRIRAPASDEQGAVALLMALLIFFGLILTGIIVDYSRYIAASQEMKNAADRVVIKGGTQCMSSLLGSIQKHILSSNNPDVTALIKKAMQDGETQAAQEFDRTLKELPTSIKPGPFSIVAHSIFHQNFCAIELRYTVFVSLMTGSFLGIPTVTLSGKVMAGAVPKSSDKTNFSVNIIAGAMSGTLSGGEFSVRIIE